MMKNLILLGLVLFSIQVFSQKIVKEDCDRYFKQTGLKYLECIYKFEKINPEDKIYQFYQWSAFGKTIFSNFEKRKTGYFLVSHELNQPIYNEKTEEFDYPITVCQSRKLTEKEFSDFERILDKHKFWVKPYNKPDIICTDGSGIIFQALNNDDYRNYSNGNCQFSDDYLNLLYTEIKSLLKL